jgi:hypothetical protein
MRGKGRKEEAAKPEARDEQYGQRAAALYQDVTIDLDTTNIQVDGREAAINGLLDRGMRPGPRAAVM